MRLRKPERGRARDEWPREAEYALLPPPPPKEKKEEELRAYVGREE